MTRPIQATIRRSALRNNLALARRLAPHARILAVAKANAYGHGLPRVADALQDADGLAVLELDAAVRLREGGYNRRVVMLEGAFDLLELSYFSQYRLTGVVHCVEQVDMLEQMRLPEPVDVFLKLNTGMNRLGLPVNAYRPQLERLRASASVGEITLMTHFANADDARGIDWQLQTFVRTTAELEYAVSVANSATLLAHPAAATGWVRPGIMLYGASPFADRSARELGLLPAMTLTSKIIAVQTLQRGDTVGYGGAYSADGPMRIGIVACGYGDGYPRHAPTGTPVLVDGARGRLVGRVSMDLMSVDLTESPRAGVGSSIVLWGDGLPIEEVATAAGTISYELLCALALRVPVAEAP